MYEQIAAMMEEMGLPFAYHHFAEGESPSPPFLLFLSPGEHTFSADNYMYHSFKMLDIELYTDKKAPDLEKQVESVCVVTIFITRKLKHGFRLRRCMKCYTKWRSNLWLTRRIK